MMEWISIKDKPKEKGQYICYVPENRYYNEHWGEYYWNGKDFIDTQAIVGNDRIVEASHYIKLTKPL